MNIELKKEHKLRLYFCVGCETLGIARKQTEAEKLEYKKKYGDKSIPKFEHTELIEVKACDCGSTSDWVMNWPTTLERIKELTI